MERESGGRGGNKVKEWEMRGREEAGERRIISRGGEGTGRESEVEGQGGGGG